MIRFSVLNVALCLLPWSRVSRPCGENKYSFSLMLLKKFVVVVTNKHRAMSPDVEAWLVVMRYLNFYNV